MRKANLIQTAIWKDGDFLGLSADEKFVYLTLLTQSDVATTGRLPVTARRWAKMTSLKPGKVDLALERLDASDFVWVDSDGEEAVIRSWVKHNVIGNSKMEKAAVDQFPAVISPRLRVLLADEYPTLFHVEQDDRTAITGGEQIPYPQKQDGVSENRDGLSQELAGARGVKGRGTEVVLSGSSLTQRSSSRARVWGVYHDYHPHAQFLPDREKRLDRWLGVYDEDFLVDAVHGNHLDPHCNGENDRGTEYHDFDLIFRSADHIERFAGVKRNGKKPTSQPGRRLQMAREAQWLEEREGA